MMMHFPIVIHKDRNSDYGVTVPDLPGCFSAGSSVEEALSMAKEAIELHLEGLIDEGQPIPEPHGVEPYLADPLYAGGTWALVSVDRASLRVKAKRVNITMPERILDAVDRFAAQSGETRSGLLSLAVTDYIARRNAAANHSARSKPKRREVTTRKR